MAVQQGVISLDTDDNYSVATLTNGAGDSLNVYYMSTTGGIIALSNGTLTNAVLVAQGASATT